MRKLWAALFCAFALTTAAAAVSTSAGAAVLLETTTGTRLYEQNADARLPMASTTKIMTAYVAIKYGDINSRCAIPAEAVGVEGSSMYLAEGEIYTLNELLYGLMLTSGNDAAAAVAIHVAGSVADFVKLMNYEAAALGFTDTRFDNPSGLDSETHYTTAGELALLAATALENPEFLRYVSTKSFIIPAADTHPARFLGNKNRMLTSYEGAIGVKTGYTKHSGRSLVSAAEREGVRLVAVTINDPDDWRDHEAMLDHGFERTVSVDPMSCLQEEYILPVAGGGSLRVRPDPAPAIVLIDMPEPVITAKIILPHFVYAGTGLMSQVGEARVFSGDELICTLPLRAFDSLRQEPASKKTLWELICGLF